MRTLIHLWSPQAEKGIQTSLTPSEEASLTYTDTDQNTTTVEVPTNAVTEEMDLVYQPIADVGETSNSFNFAGCAFELDVYVDENKQDDFSFEEEIYITLEYTDENIAGLDEDNLKLMYWGGNNWQDAACGPVERNIDENWIKVPVCHLTEFGLFDRSFVVYIPLVLRWIQQNTSFEFWKSRNSGSFGLQPKKIHMFGALDPKAIFF